MESILQFMYLGEGRFYYERMGEFIKVAKDLEVKEISKGMEIANEEKDAPEESIIDDKEKGFDEYHEPKQTQKNKMKIRQRLPRNKKSSDSKCPDLRRHISVIVNF